MGSFWVTFWVRLGSLYQGVFFPRLMVTFGGQLFQPLSVKGIYNSWKLKSQIHLRIGEIILDWFQEF